MRSIRLSLTTFAALSLFIVGCGSSSDDGSGATPTEGAGGATAGSGGSTATTGGQAGAGVAGHVTAGTGGVAGSGTAGHATAGTGGTGTAGSAGTGATGGSTGTAGSAGAGAGGAAGGTTGQGGSAGVSATGGSSGSGGNNACSAGSAGSPISATAVRVGDGGDTYLGTTTTGIAITARDNGDMMTFTLTATPIDGSGSPTTISSTAFTAYGVETNADLFFYYTSPNTTTGTGTLSAWTPSAGSVVLVATGAAIAPQPAADTDPASNLLAVSADGKTVIVPTAADASKGATTTLVRENVDGSNPVTIAVTDLADQTACITTVATSGDAFVVAACDPTTDIATYYALRDGSSTPAVVATHLASVVYDPAGHSLFGVASSGNGSIFSLDGDTSGGGGTGGGGGAAGAGGAPAAPTGTLIDTGVGNKTVVPNYFGGHFSKDGQTIFYSTKAGLWKKSDVTTPAPVTIQSGVALVENYFTDTYTFFSKTADKTGVGDLFLSNDTDNSSVPVSADKMSIIFGDGFTVDDTYLLYYNQVDLTAGIGQFVSAPLAGTPATTRGDVNGWDVYAIGGTNVVYNDNYQPPPLNSPMGTYGNADIYVLDVATAGPPKLLIAGAYANFFLTPDKKAFEFEYTDPCGDATVSGVYVQKFP